MKNVMNRLFVKVYLFIYNLPKANDNNTMATKEDDSLSLLHLETNGHRTPSTSGCLKQVQHIFLILYSNEIKVLMLL